MLTFRFPSSSPLPTSLLVSYSLLSVPSAAALDTLLGMLTVKVVVDTIRVQETSRPLVVVGLHEIEKKFTPPRSRTYADPSTLPSLFADPPTSSTAGLDAMHKAKTTNSLSARHTPPNRHKIAAERRCSLHWPLTPQPTLKRRGSLV
ncbi:hypothetical protein NLJ89_g11948 [Agrocybe chaxingu]|uniref:Uncharacterized protein n=1 Tax=Agrocybe chaxingu TaxID=84603 RepID=A0A9W8JVT1_9AGAR|nr:hypothetical protein NLJ89_g11948 [Agrocybe chaxingu]